jgi:hypothetical protein
MILSLPHYCLRRQILVLLIIQNISDIHRKAFWVPVLRQILRHKAKFTGRESTAVILQQVFGEGKMCQNFVLSSLGSHLNQPQGRERCRVSGEIFNKQNICTCTFCPVLGIRIRASTKNFSKKIFKTEDNVPVGKL